MRIERSIHEPMGRDDEPARAPVGCAVAPDGDEPLRLPAHHLHLMRVSHGAPPLRSRALANRSLTPDARRAIHERLLDGTYVAPRVIDELARRLLASAHL